MTTLRCINGLARAITAVQSVMKRLRPEDEVTVRLRKVVDELNEVMQLIVVRGMNND